jgi:hypothetical protein
METFQPVRVPGGVWRGGELVRELRARALTGHDEEWLLDHADRRPVEVTTDLLVRCLANEDGAPLTAEEVDGLTVGDREALLWHLRRGASGDRIDVIVECGACGEKLDVPMTVSVLLAAPYDEQQPAFTDAIDGASVTYRLPTGADQRATLDLEPEAAVAVLLERCVSSIDGGDPDPTVLATRADAIADAMAARDPQAETTLEATCLGCGAQVVALLDAFVFLREETVQRARVLFDEVHTLAWHYHWGEADILAMTAPRRQRYLDRIAQVYEAAG